jgi:hypothetical protein
VEGHDVWQWIGPPVAFLWRWIGPPVALVAILLFRRHRLKAIANRPEAAASDEAPPEMMGFMSIARVLSRIAVVLGAIASLCGLAIVIGGRFSCAQFGVSHNYPASSFIALPLVSLFIVAASKMMAAGRHEMLIREFRLYNVPLFNLFSRRVTFSAVFFSVYLTVLVAVLGGGIAFSLAPLWSILTECVKRAG